MKLGTVQIYASIIVLKKHGNQAWGSLYFADVNTIPPKLPIFWKVTFMTSRVKNYVLTINLGSRGFLIDISEFYDVYKYFVLKTK